MLVLVLVRVARALSAKAPVHTVLLRIALSVGGDDHSANAAAAIAARAASSPRACAAHRGLSDTSE